MSRSHQETPKSGPEDNRSSWWARAINRALPGSIGGLLVLLMLAFIVAEVLDEIDHYHALFQEESADVLEQNLEIARGEADTFKTYVNDVLHQEYTIGLVLATQKSLTTPEINQFLGEIARRYPAMRHISWTDPQGRIIASNDPDLIGMPLKDIPYIQPILNGQEWEISDLFQSPTTGSPTFLIARGYLDDHGVLQGIAIAALDPERLGEVLQIERSAGGTLVLIDRNSRIVYFYPEVKLTWEQRGSLENDPQTARALGGEEVTERFVSSLDGFDDWRMTPIQPIGWVSRASTPVAGVFAPLYEELFRESLTTLAIMFVALTAALLIARSITGPTNRLRARVSALGQAEPIQKSEETRPKEIKELSDAFNKMAGEIEVRAAQREQYIADLTQAEKELRESEERYRPWPRLPMTRYLW